MDKRIAPEKRIGMVIRQLRIEKDLTQDQLAVATGLHKSYVGMVERGETNLTIKTVVKFAKAFETNASTLLAIAEV